ncbi:MAG: hypothetical protein V1647_02445 [Pseudomonadota bacterium]
MKIFFGAAIQGHNSGDQRSHVYKRIIEVLKNNGAHVLTEHTTGKDLKEVLSLLEKSIGVLPKDDLERRIYVRDKMIEFVESDIDAAVFEVSTPSLGTGVELTHAYLRPRMGLKEIPILILYQEDYWHNKLSTMIQGLANAKYPNIYIKQYGTMDELDKKVLDFLKAI